MKDLEKIDKSLEQLSKDFNSQLEALGSNTNDFHNAMIDLTAKYPQHKDLLRFMVFINDKLETHQLMFTDIVVESFNELIKTKKDLVQKIMDEKGTRAKSSEDSLWSKVKNMTGAMKNVKVILTTIAVILLSAAAIMAPDMFITIIKELAKLL